MPKPNKKLEIKQTARRRKKKGALTNAGSHVHGDYAWIAPVVVIRAGLISLTSKEMQGATYLDRAPDGKAGRKQFADPRSRRALLFIACLASDPSSSSC